MAKSTANKKNEFKVRESVLDFVKLADAEKWFKKQGLKKEKKKEKQRIYFSRIMDLLPDVLYTLVHYGHIREIQELKEDIYAVLTTEKLPKFIKDEIKGGFEIDNIELLPICIADILTKHAAALVNTETGEVTDESEIVDLSDLAELSEFILKKPLKKLEKKGIDRVVAFDILSVFPTGKLMGKNVGVYQLNNMMRILYAHAKEKEIDFKKIFKVIFDDTDMSSVYLFFLLERKNKMGDFNDTQKKLFNEITLWLFSEIESLKKDQIRELIEAYVKARKNDDSKQRDGIRRYSLTSIPDETYPKTFKVVMKLSDDDNKKYLQ